MKFFARPASGISLLTIASLLDAAGAALAGDAEDARRRRIPPSAFEWNGFYAGGHVGVGFADNRFSIIEPASTTLRDHSQRGVGGVQAGYNFLLPSRVMLGVEADATFMYFFESDDIVVERTTTRGSNLAQGIDYISTLRGRVGYAFDRWMPYVTGGLAWSQSRIIEDPGVGMFADKKLVPQSGWAIGAGVEYAIAPDWTARAEYLYDRFGDITTHLPSGTAMSSTLDVHMLRVGLNRKLRWPGDEAPASELQNGPPRNTIAGICTANTPSSGRATIASIRPMRGPTACKAKSNSRTPKAQRRSSAFGRGTAAEIYVNPELMQGFGLSDVRGLAGFPNGEAQKSNFPYPRLNIARAYMRQTFGLGGEQEAIEDGPNQLAGKQDISRISVAVGKFAVTDFFDGNSYANDPRTSFLNWNIYGGGAYDWTMDKLSWTWGAVDGIQPEALGHTRRLFSAANRVQQQQFRYGDSTPWRIRARSGIALCPVVAARQDAAVRLDQSGHDGWLCRRLGAAGHQCKLSRYCVDATRPHQLRRSLQYRTGDHRRSRHFFARKLESRAGRNHRLDRRSSGPVGRRGPQGNVVGTARRPDRRRRGHRRPVTESHASISPPAALAF